MVTGVGLIKNQTDKLITKLNLCESGSEETRNEMLARVFEEPALLTPKTAFMHAHDVIKGFWSLGEEVIQDDAELSYRYAVFTKERFLEGENAIAMHPKLSYQYAMDVLDRKPFPAGEPMIATNAYYSYLYAILILHGPFPAGEAAIAKYGAAYSKWYVYEVLDGDWSRFNRDENR